MIMIDGIILTSEGLKKLQKELEYLKKIRRVEVSERIRIAKEFGDLSENAEYHDSKEEQAFVEGRILEIEHILKTAHIADKAGTSEAGIGTHVTLIHEKKRIAFEIVGSTESDPSHGKISIDSPLGQVLIGKKSGDTVDLSTPTGTKHYSIEKLS